VGKILQKSSLDVLDEPLETDRILFRAPTLDDAEAMFVYAKDPEISRFTSLKVHQSIDDTMAFIKSILEKNKGSSSRFLGIFLKNSPNTIIGTLDITATHPSAQRCLSLC